MEARIERPTAIPQRVVFRSRSAGALHAEPAVRPDLDAVMAELATRQHGVVRRDQLLRAGVASHRIEHRVASGRLHVEHRGVYRVGPIATPRSREVAAILACGGSGSDATAVISHRSAGTMSGQIPHAPASVELIVPRWSGRRRAGLCVHRMPLAADEITRIEGIPVTTPARTLLDLAAVLPRRDLERALAVTQRRELATDDQIRVLLERHAGRAGTRRLGDLLESDPPAPFTRSEPEERLLDLIRKAKLPVPKANVVVEGFEVDFLWRRQRLVVEVDGFAYHSSPRAFERDHDRDGVLVGAGMRVLRLSWRQIVHEPEVTIVRLAQSLVQ